MLKILKDDAVYVLVYSDNSGKTTARAFLKRQDAIDERERQIAAARLAAEKEGTPALLTENADSKLLHIGRCDWQDWLITKAKLK